MPSSTSTQVYKGKITHRSWQHLPPEIIRLIATHYLLDVSSFNYIPQVWGAREHWLHRMVYIVLRDTVDIEKLMCICPAWSIALETHLFWHHACSVIDPQDLLAHHALVRPLPQPINTASSALPLVAVRYTPYRHFRNIINCTCYVCRINHSYTTAGLGQAAKRAITTPFLPVVPVCKEHRKHTFCGVCLREAPSLESENDHNAVCCAENEDAETWPDVDATCRSCRQEWLWQRVACNPHDREAVGGRKWESPDWETRQIIDAFIETGDGTINDVIQLAREKHWYRKFTKLPDMLSQAVAASRYANREESGFGYGSSEDGSVLEEEDDEDDYELMGLTEDASNVRGLAISDWARNRILDGHWYSPADQYFGYTVNGLPTVVRAEHPCPWTRDSAASDAEVDGESDRELEFRHPTPKTICGDIPPSFSLCEQSYNAYQRQMQKILLPAMKNIVRKLIIECTADGIDPTLRASRMAVEDVAGELRDEGVWYNGIDWLERRRNGRTNVEARGRPSSKKEPKDDGDNSSSSSKSDESHATSPVLSTSTLQTTPSPPPSEAKGEKETLSAPPPPSMSIPVSPVLASPVLIHPIPYIPVTMNHLPKYSIDSFQLVWREACAPLYHCRCSICERAAIKANEAQAGTPVVPTQSSQTARVTSAAPLERPVEILIEEIHEDGEDEVEVGEGEDGEEVEEEEEDGEEAEQEEQEEEEQEEEEESEEDSEIGVVDSSDPEGAEGERARATRWQEHWRRPVKRSSADLDDDDADAEGESVGGDSRGSKRAKRGVERVKVGPPLNAKDRLKKRSSEDLVEDGAAAESGKPKRRKTGSEESPGTTPPPSAAENAADSGADDEERDRKISRLPSRATSLRPGRTQKTISKSDLNALYTFEQGAVV